MRDAVCSYLDITHGITCSRIIERIFMMNDASLVCSIQSNCLCCCSVVGNCGLAIVERVH